MVLARPVVVGAGGDVAGTRGGLLDADGGPGGGGELDDPCFDEEEGHVPLSVVVLKEGGREGRIINRQQGIGVGGRDLARSGGKKQGREGGREG